MTISILYFYDNTENIEEIINLEEEVDLTDFYIDPPDVIVQQTIAAIINL